MGLKAVAPGSASVNSSQIVGTTTNDNAAAGIVGEYMSSEVGPTSYTTSTTPQNLTSLSLTAGDWDVWGNVLYIPGTSISLAIAGFSTTTATLPAIPRYSQVPLAASTSSIGTIPPTYRFSLAATTTVYLVGNAIFVGTATFNAGMYARRVR